MKDNICWLHIDAASTRLFRVGECVRAGETLGQSLSGSMVRPSTDGEVVQIQYDIDNNEIILAVASLCYSNVA